MNVHVSKPTEFSKTDPWLLSEDFLDKKYRVYVNDLSWTFVSVNELNSLSLID